MDVESLPDTDICDLSTTGRRSGQRRRVEIWYVIVDGQIVVTGTPGPRDWLANLRLDPHATLDLRNPPRTLTVIGQEVVADDKRRRIAEHAHRLQPWYADQPYTVADWVSGSPMVVLVPA